jgi:hypothetical protein
MTWEAAMRRARYLVRMTGCRHEVYGYRRTHLGAGSWYAYAVRAVAR